jgi:23S rRNA A1618 N6-methylase RlmF
MIHNGSMVNPYSVQKVGKCAIRMDTSMAEVRMPDSCLHGHTPSRLVYVEDHADRYPDFDYVY